VSKVSSSIDEDVLADVVLADPGLDLVGVEAEQMAAT
jgi:hypothetical protein